jgi:hypothetical protein
MQTSNGSKSEIPVGTFKGPPYDNIRKLAKSRSIEFTPSARPVQGGIQMRSRLWMVIAAAALVTFATVIIKKLRERAEAERMMVWG